MKKVFLIAFLTISFTQNIQSSYESELDEKIKNINTSLDQLLTQLVEDLEHQKKSNEAELLPVDQSTLMTNYYASQKILHDEKIKNMEQNFFAETDANAAFYIQKKQKTIAFMDNGLTLYQADSAVKMNLTLEQALGAAQQGTLATAESLSRSLACFGNLPATIQKLKDKEIKSSNELRKKFIFVGAGLKLSQAGLAARHNLTLDQALSMKQMLLERNGINDNNDGYKEIIAQIKNE